MPFLLSHRGRRCKSSSLTSAHNLLWFSSLKQPLLYCLLFLRYLKAVGLHVGISLPQDCPWCLLSRQSEFFRLSSRFQYRSLLPYALPIVSSYAVSMILAFSLMLIGSPSI